MSDVVTFVPDQMYGFAVEADGWAASVRDEAAEVGDALARFRSSSTEFVPALPDHESAMEALGDRLVSLSEGVGALGSAAEQADREGVRLSEVLTAVGGGINLASSLAGASEALLQYTRFSVYSSRALRTGRTLAQYNRLYGTGGMPSTAHVRARVPGGMQMPRSEIRRIRSQLHQQIKGPRRATLAAHYRNRFSLRSRPPVTAMGGRINHFLTNTRTGSAIRVGGRVLGGAGVVLSGIDAVQGFREGDVERGVTSTVSAVGGAMMLAGGPAGVVVGGALVIGALAYQHREAIGEALEDVGEGVADVAEGAVDAGRGLVEGAGRVLGGIF